MYAFLNKEICTKNTSVHNYVPNIDNNTVERKKIYIAMCIFFIRKEGCNE